MSMWINVQSAQLKIDTDNWGKMDPYYEICHSTGKYRSETLEEAGKNPKWMKWKEFANDDKEWLEVNIKEDDNSFWGDDWLGQVWLPLEFFRCQRKGVLTAPLMRDGENTGDVTIQWEHCP